MLSLFLQSRYTTPRKEDDAVEIMSGIFEGRTTGTPISLIVYNKNARSSDYSDIAQYYRPGHADYTFDAKYGFRDYRGGGRSSGRETIGRVAAGAVALKILESLHVQLTTYSSSIGPVQIPEKDMDFSVISQNPLAMPNLDYAKKAAGNTAKLNNSFTDDQETLAYFLSDINTCSHNQCADGCVLGVEDAVQILTHYAKSAAGSTPIWNNRW